MTRFLKIIIVLFITVFTLLMCKNSPSGSDPDPTSNEQYTLDVEIDPSSGDPGSVEPSDGTYNENETVTIEAIPDSSNNWQFDRWGGATTSSNNPITLTMDSDKTLTAYFVQENTADAFQGNMKVSDGTHTRDDLVFALIDGSGYQEGLDGNDVESPPIAPPGAFFTGFKHQGMNLYEDYRPKTSDINEVIWELRLHRNSSNSMSIDWSFSDQVNSGELMLVSDPSASNPLVEVDMLSQSSYSVTDPSVTSLFIVYSVPQSKSRIADNNAGSDDEVSTEREILNPMGKKDVSVDHLKTRVKKGNK